MSERETFNSGGMLLAGAVLNRNGEETLTWRYEYQDGSVIKTSSGTSPADQGRTSPDKEYDWYGGARRRVDLIQYDRSSVSENGEQCRAAVIRGERPKCGYVRQTWDASGNQDTEERYGTSRDETEYRVTLVTWKFDDAGRPVEGRVSKDGALEGIDRYKYEADAVGNWTKQVETLVDPNDGEGTVLRITYRRIKYF